MLFNIIFNRYFFQLSTTCFEKLSTFLKSVITRVHDPTVRDLALISGKTYVVRVVSFKGFKPHSVSVDVNVHRKVARRKIRVSVVA